jgi:hypothetical protein
MMTETIAPAESQAAESPRIPRPHTDAAALRAIEEATAHVRERALKIRENPEEHKPKLVLSQHVRGTSILDRIADAVNKFCGSMYVFIGITIGIVAWLFLGNKDMPGRQAHIQDCVDQILAKVDSRPAAAGG